MRTEFSEEAKDARLTRENLSKTNKQKRLDSLATNQQEHEVQNKRLETMLWQQEPEGP